MKYREMIQKICSIKLILAAVFRVSSTVRAAPGDVDSSFTPPSFSASFPFSSVSINASVLQPDGKIIVGSSFTVLGNFTDFKENLANLTSATGIIARVFGSNAPTAASVAVSGRVLNASGRGIGKARVTITDSSGETRKALTNSFGYYLFTDVPAGETYIFSVSAKRFSFGNSAQARSIVEETDDINFIAGI